VKVCLRILCACSVLAATLQANGAVKKVTTVAGGYIGDGKPATSASFTGLFGIAVDKKGNVYLSDGCRIRRVNKLGVISTFAGGGVCGYGGDGGPRKAALFNGTEGLAFDSQGNLLLADAANDRVRKISPAGIVTTIAGNGTRGYSGDGGPATHASLAVPVAVAADPSGNVYIAESYNYIIRMVDTAGVIHTVAGNNTYGFSGDGGPATSAQITSPAGVWADASGNFYISDSSNGRIRKVDSSGTITTFAGSGGQRNTGSGGPATQAGLGGTYGLFVAQGTMYIATGSNVWVIDMTTETATLIAGNADGSMGFNGDGHLALSTTFNYVEEVAVDTAGNLLVVDSSNQRVRKIDASQMVTTFAGGYVGDGGAPTAASLNLGYIGGRIAFDPSGNLYVADTLKNRVRKVSTTGVITTFAGTGLSGSSGDGGLATAATLNQPVGLAIDRNGNVFIADNGVIRKVDSNGTITTFVSTIPVLAPWGATIDVPPAFNGLAIDAQGNLYSSSFGYGLVFKISPGGTGSVIAGVLFRSGYNGDGISAQEAYLDLPTGVAVDSSGNVFIADWENARIRKVDTSGMISTVAGNGLGGFGGDGGPATSANLSLPIDVAVDGNGQLYIADSLNYRVRVVDTTGNIQTLVGTGQGGYNGNALPPTATNVFPVSVAVGPKGVIHFSDGASERVRKVH